MLVQINSDIALDPDEVFVVKCNHEKRVVVITFRDHEAEPVVIEPEIGDRVSDLLAEIVSIISAPRDPYTRVVAASPQMQEGA